MIYEWTCYPDQVKPPTLFGMLLIPSFSLHRGRARDQKRVKSLPDDLIAFARCFFETGTIKYLHLSSAIADEPSILHRLRRKCYRLSIGTQYVRKKLVRVGEIFAFGPIMHHEQPPAHSLLGRMQSIAGDGLLDLSLIHIS